MSVTPWAVAALGVAVPHVQVVTTLRHVSIGWPSHFPVMLVIMMVVIRLKSDYDVDDTNNDDGDADDDENEDEYYDY